MRRIWEVSLRLKNFAGEACEVDEEILWIRTRNGKNKLTPPQGYALVEFPTQREAKAAIEGANNTKLLDQTISVDFAFVRPPPAKDAKGQGKAGKGGRRRSRSPEDGKKG